MNGEKAGIGCLGVLIGIFGGVVLAIVMGWLIILAIISACSNANTFQENMTEYGNEKPENEKPLTRKWMRGDGDATAPKLVYIKLLGQIGPDDDDQKSILQPPSKSSTRQMLKAIEEATRDPEIRGLCLYLDTPGGTVFHADLLANAVAKFKSSRNGRFVMVQMGSLCCSGGYYVAAGADYIMAYPTTLTGSIGVIMNTINAAGLAEKIGVKSVVIATGNNKALLNPLEPVNPEHVEIFKNAVSQDYDRFLQIVSQGRNISLASLRPLADGRVLTAQDALKANLIDAIGYDYEFWQQACKMAKSKAIRVYRYESPLTFWNWIETSVNEGCIRTIQKTLGVTCNPQAPTPAYKIN